MIPLCILLAAYLATSIYFVKHFYLNTKINGIDVSGKTVEEAESQMMSKLKSYTLTLKERGNKSEQVNMNDIDLKYKSSKQIEDLKAEQNPLTWVSAFFNSMGNKTNEKVTYDEKLLEEQVDKLSAFATGNVTEPKEPSLKYENNAYVIVNEVRGNKVDKDALLKCVENAISNDKTTIDLEAANCYINPQYTSKSKKVIEARDTLNKYVSSKITYNFGDSKVTLDGSTINKYLTVDKNYDVSIDEKKVKSYVQSLSNTYDTLGKTRNFTTTSGSIISVSGGDYGWQMDVSKEAKNMATAIKDGQTVTKTPSYIHTAASHGSNDIGNTYVEIDMTKQHLWFYKNGSLVVEGDVVTGNVSEDHATPSGVYRLKYKERNATLKGQGYTSPVSYWMPFNNGIGMHDSNWRSTYGGEIYKTGGSHGCVNCPYSLAQTIYENIDPGTPVVCFY